MNIKLITWKIVGIKPLIQSNPHEMWKDENGDDGDEVVVSKGRKALRGTDQQNFTLCQKQLYINEEGKHYHPAVGFMKNLEMACDQRQLGKKNALTIVSSAVALVDHEFFLYDPTTLGAKVSKLVEGNEWQIDYRRAVNHNKNKTDGGVGVVAIRPKWKQWGGFVTLEVDMDFFAGVEGLTELMNVGGHYYGIGVGRKRVKAIVRQKPEWSDMLMGRYSAELMNGQS